MTDTAIVQRNVDAACDFLAALAGKNIEGLINALAPDALYYNMPLVPIHGRDEFRAFWEPFYMIIRTYRIEHNKLDGKGNFVFSERMEYFKMEPDGNHIELPVAGVFDFNDNGKIVAWREYWDSNTWTSQGGTPFE
jgi:limonene-1,2-epoxide hydrolase